jgi:molecular chaperone IbpA
MTDLFSHFRKFDPFSIGFNDVFNDLESMSKSIAKAAMYPPYNIKQVKENKFVIEMAVAGFAQSDIEVTLEGNKLVIKGNTEDSDDAPENFIYKGIANRNFTREFKLADKVEIENAELMNGMLKIGLSNMIRVQDQIKKIPLMTGTFTPETKAKYKTKETVDA